MTEGWVRSAVKLPSIFDLLSSTSRAFAIASSKASSADTMDVLAAFEVLDADAEGVGGDVVPWVRAGRELRTFKRSSIHLDTAPDTPSSTLKRSSIASLVTLSIDASWASVNVGGNCDMGGREVFGCWYLLGCRWPFN